MTPRFSLYFLTLSLLVLMLACGNSGEETGDAPGENGDARRDDGSLPSPSPGAADKNAVNLCPKGTALTYGNFGKFFMQSHCLACHDQSLIGPKRHGAAKDVNLLSPKDIVVWRSAIIQVMITTNKMPPSKSVPEGEMELAKEWLGCGAPY